MALEAAARYIIAPFASASAAFALSAQVAHHPGLRRHAHLKDNCMDGIDQQSVCSSVRVKVSWSVYLGMASLMQRLCILEERMRISEALDSDPDLGIIV